LIKILIVDDEFLVRLGLKTTINWTQFGYEIVGEASNGREALQLFEKFKPDILMTDIKMPDMDGLELISEIRQKDKNAQIIILSNYRDFDYARQAIKFGVSQYLIKSDINEKNLMDTLKSLTFVHESKPDASPGSTQEQQKYIQKQIVNMQNCTPSHKMFALPAAGLFPQPKYYLMCCSCDVSQLESDTVNMLEKMLDSLMESRFHGAVYGTEVLRQKLVSGVIVPAPQLNDKETDYLAEQGKLLIRNVKQYNEVDLTIGISLPGDCARFPAMFTEAELARQNCFFTSTEISLYNKKFSQEKDESPKVGFVFIKELIDSNSWQRLKDYITDIFVKLRKLEKYEYLRSCYIDFLFIAKSLCEDYHVNGFSADKFDYESLSVIPTINLVEDHVCNLYCELFNVIQNVGRGHSYYIKACLAFISNNYHTNITLNDAAKTTNISSSYLSLIFKQEIGINFSDYLTQYRIEQAKQLLTTTSLHVYEIAQKVGFSSPYYFSRVFKDVTKMTCKDYKDRFIKV
jgi:Response regulator containing CheY-like receiver domain and AraC-type DNA-binding domain